MKVIFMGTPEFAVPSLESIYNNGYDIPLVITQEDRRRGRGKKLHPTEVKAKALELGLDVYQPKSINSEEAIEKIRSYNPDFIVVAAYGQILKKEILEIAKYNIINVHSSLLPKYRGAAPINWAIVNGEKETGVTIMEVEEGLDSGDIILQESIPIEYEDNASTIHDKLAILGGKLVVEAMKGLEEGTINKVPQVDEDHTYAPTLSRESGNIDWNMTATEIRNLIRGFTPWPSAFTKYKEETLKIHNVEALDEEFDGEIGEIVKVDNEAIYVKAKNSTVKVLELQFPGNRKMKTEDYLRGNDIEEGVILKK